MKILKKPTTVPEYISRFPAAVQKNLKKIRNVIKKVAPDVAEKIGYGIPSYSHNGILIYFAAYKSHIGLYAMPSAVKKFEKQLKKYETSTGTIRFPLDEPIPEALITKIVKFRVKENLEKKKGKKNQPKIFR